MNTPLLTVTIILALGIKWKCCPLGAPVKKIRIPIFILARWTDVIVVKVISDTTKRGKRDDKICPEYLTFIVREHGI
jgi:hypothetical protein